MGNKATLQVHLHTHSYFSFLEGVPSPGELVQAAVKGGMQALALTDHRSLTGAVEFYDACTESGIKPILGLDIDIALPGSFREILLLLGNMISMV